MTEHKHEQSIEQAERTAHYVLKIGSALARAYDALGEAEDALSKIDEECLCVSVAKNTVSRLLSGVQARYEREQRALKEFNQKDAQP